MPSVLTNVRPPDIRVLDADPDLTAGLAPAQAQAATTRACAPVHVLDPGAWDPAKAPSACIGLLVLDGMLSRVVTLAGRSATELLGTGDLLRPWQRDGEDGLLQCDVEWRVLERTRVAVLDDRFAAAIAPWPQIGAELVGRALQRSRWHGVAAAISHMTRVDDRLLLAFWTFAERWGRVRADGVVIRLPLTHEALGELIGARRPSVTSALSSLGERGLLRSLARGEWLLTERASAWRESLGTESQRALAA